LQIPDKPPYRVYIGNVAYDLTEDAVEKFIGDTRVLEILVTRHRDTGKARGCFVEFHNVDDMKLCLEKDGQMLAGRNARIQVAQRRENLKQDTKRSNGILRGKPRRNDRSKEWEPPMPTEESLKSRPRLKLKPRSQKNTSESVEASSGGKANPFGGARPADTASKLAELEMRDMETKQTDDTVDEEPQKKNRDVKPKGPRILKDEVVKTKIAQNPFDLLAEDDE
jgi:RNA recognition motif-containing protein